MLVSLSDVLTSEGKVETVAIPLEMTSFKSRQGDFSITEKTPINLTFTNIGVNKAKVTGTAELTFDTKCDRCLTEVPTAMKLKFDRIVYSPEVEVSEEEDTEQSFMDGWQLDVEAFVYDEILVNWPAKILCKEDCKGICPVCGQNRNLKECGCDTFVPDPRMAAIQDIFNANKEV